MAVYIHVDVKNPEGFRALSEKLIAFVRDEEPGTVRYEWHLSRDGRTGLLVDGYDSTESFLLHMRHMQEHGYLDQLADVAEFDRITITGDPSPEADPLIELFGAEVLTTVGTRWRSI